MAIDRAQPITSGLTALLLLTAAARLAPAEEWTAKLMPEGVQSHSVVTQLCAQLHGWIDFVALAE